MPIQDMPHCKKHCVELLLDSWCCDYKKWWRRHKRKHFVGCYFGNIFLNEIVLEEFEKLKEK